MAAHPFSRAIAGLGRVVAYYPVLAHALGGVNAALLLSQLSFLLKGLDSSLDYPFKEEPTSWISLSSAQVMRQTGMTRSELEGARRQLRALDVLHEERRGMPATLSYYVDFAKVDLLLQSYLDMNPALSREDKVAKRKQQARQSEVIPAKEPGLVNRLYEAFNKHYDQAHNLPFSWGTGSGTSGKHWRALSQIGSALRDKMAAKALMRARDAADNQPARMISDQEIVDGFEFLLQNLPPYYRTERFSPMSIYSNLDEIIQKITQIKKQGNENSTGGSRPAKPNHNSSTDGTRWA